MRQAARAQAPEGLRIREAPAVGDKDRPPTKLHNRETHRGLEGRARAMVQPKKPRNLGQKRGGAKNGVQRHAEEGREGGKQNEAQGSP